MRRRFTTNKGLTKNFDVNNYLTIEALEDNLILSFTRDIEYGIDGKGWIKLKNGSKTPSINTGQTLSFKGNLTPNSIIGIGTFTISKKCNIKGNIMSMLFGDDFIGQNDLSGNNYAFYRLFYDCNTIIDASELILPATTLADYCYYDMFWKCTSLVTAPSILPATELAEHCYVSMFNGCTSLVSAPELPATTLADYCYASMFYGCTSLTAAPKLPATTLSNSCYNTMFQGCTSLVTAPELPATTLAYNCYQYMFDGCRSLTTAPELPATTLVSSCYKYMFRGCSKLNYIKALFTTEPSSSYTNNWVTGVSSTGTFIKNSIATWDVTGVNGIPSGWTVIEDTPNLITFTIDGIEYQAEEGMTWESWVDSEYNHELSGTLTAFAVGLITTVSNDYIVYARESSTTGVGVQHTFNRLGKKVDPVSISEVIESKEYNIFNYIS